MIMMSEDFLSSWRKQRLAELKKQFSEAPSQKEETSKKAVSDRDIVLPALEGRAQEVLRTAEAQYPSEMARIEAELARLIREGGIKGPITGEALFTLFRRLGLRVRLDTKITYFEKGRTKSLSEKIKGE